MLAVADVVVVMVLVAAVMLAAAEENGHVSEWAVCRPMGCRLVIRD